MCLIHVDTHRSRKNRVGFGVGPPKKAHSRAFLLGNAHRSRGQRLEVATSHPAAATSRTHNSLLVGTLMGMPQGPGTEPRKRQVCENKDGTQSRPHALVVSARCTKDSLVPLQLHATRCANEPCVAAIPAEVKIERINKIIRLWEIRWHYGDVHIHNCRVCHAITIVVGC